MSGLFYQLHNKCKKEKLQQFQVTPVRKRDQQNQGDDFDEDDDQEVEGLRVESAMTTKNRVIEASMKRINELAAKPDEPNGDLMKNIIGQDSLRALAANPALTNQLL